MKKIKLDEEYYEIVNPILYNAEFLKRKKYRHHNQTSVYDHCMQVSVTSYKIAKKLKCDYKGAAIAGLLHDFYDKPWLDNVDPEEKKKPLWKKHGFAHARQAMVNAERLFPEFMTPSIKNAIVRHMFPLNITPPKYKISWIVTIADKYVSMEVFKHPKELYRYVGIDKIKKKENRKK